MKLIFQIAGGIILAGIILVGGRYAYIQYELHELQKVLADQVEQLKQRQAQVTLQRQLEEKRQHVDATNKNLLREKQLRIQEKLRIEQEKKRLVQLQKEAKKQRQKSLAWEIFYQIPYNCKHPDSQRESDWCWKQYRAEKNKFEGLWSKGSLSVN
jgi:hypothetical protein